MSSNSGHDHAFLGHRQAQYQNLQSEIAALRDELSARPIAPATGIESNTVS